MAEETTKFTHVGIEKKTQLQISILSKVQQVRIYDLVGLWTDDAWEKAKNEGLVTDAMLGAHWVQPEYAKVDDGKLKHEDGKKLLKTVKVESRREMTKK